MLSEIMKKVENAQTSYQIAAYQMNNCRNENIFEERHTAAKNAANVLLVELTNLISATSEEIISIIRDTTC